MSRFGACMAPSAWSTGLLRVQPMLVPAHVFREYDIRGVADRELSSDLIRATGEAFAAALIEQAPKGKKLSIAVGRDCRLSSSRLFEALSEGLTRAGVDVVDKIGRASCRERA